MSKPTRLEEAFNEIGELFRALMDNAVDGLIIIDHTGMVQAFNRAAEEIFGYAGDEVIGRNVSMLMPDSFGRAHDGYIGAYLGSRVAKIIGVGREVSGKRKDGSEFPMDLSVGEIANAEGPFFVGTVRDVSDRKEREEHLRRTYKMEALGQLTGGVAHDFNNLLAVLMMDLEMLDDMTQGDDPRHELVREAREVAQAGADLTRRLLAFSRSQPLDPRAVDLAQLIRDIAGILRRTLGDEIEIDTLLPGSLWKVQADPGELENALINLSINARDAMPDGGRLSIATANTEIDANTAAALGDFSAGDYVAVSVTDTGVGMPPEVLDRAFEPFFSTKEKESGTGLGLSMVFGFVKQSGGHVGIHSRVGNGTTVSLYLPRAGSAVGRARPVGAAAGDLPGGAESILLVEDHAQLRRRGVTMLRELGYAVIEASNGPEALQTLESNAEIDLLFTDIVMPGGMTGAQLADRAETLRPGLPVLFTTGYAEHSQLPEDKRAAVLHKPFSRRELAESIRAMLDRPTGDT